MRDRMPAPGKANRIRITQDNGQIIEGVLSYADDAAQAGSAYNKANIMPDSVCDAYGVDRQNSEPRDLFAILAAIPNGQGLLVVDCREVDGTPCSGAVCIVNDYITVTNNTGLASLLLPAGDYTVRVVAPLDFGGKTTDRHMTVDAGRISRWEITHAPTIAGNTIRITQSMIGAFSRHVLQADAFAVGGGGAGGGGIAPFGDTFCDAIGGAGGYTATLLSIPLTIYKIIIGGGGIAPLYNKETSQYPNRPYYPGQSGGATMISRLDGHVLLSAAGGAGGGVGSSEGSLAVDGASGGSGSGGIFTMQAGSNGFDGASGGGFGSAVAGGSGQGRTTRLFDDPNGELFSSAGQSVARSEMRVSVMPVGHGGGLAAHQYYGEPIRHIILHGGDATTIGSGGGGLAIAGDIYHVENATTTDIRAGHGMHGMVQLRWQTSA